MAMADVERKPTRRSEPTRALSEADDVRLYLEAAAREPLLTKEEEVELAMAIEHGEEAEQRLASGPPPPPTADHNPADPARRRAAPAPPPAPAAPAARRGAPRTPRKQTK